MFTMNIKKVMRKMEKTKNIWIIYLKFYYLYLVTMKIDNTFSVQLDWITYVNICIKYFWNAY